jgi:pyruvate,orthophosphate dikinase
MMIAEGQGASPGRATGPLALSAQAAVDLAAKGTPAIYVRNEMGAEDVPAIRVAAGIVIVRAGITGDGAIAARALGKPCIVGCPSIILTASEMRCGAMLLFPGAALTIDGATGHIIKPG